jgi:hypothetical protein
MVKTMIKSNREYRALNIEKREQNAGQDAEPDYKVRGYASTFEPYVLFTDEDGTEYKEQITPEAFNEADLSDVIFLYNHEGMVYARQKNGTLDISVDEKGLHVEADLSSTQASRDLYDSIMKGLIDKMSFAFVVAEDEYDRQTHTRTISRIGKVYDVSAVSIPANPDTDIEIISARSYFDGEIEKEKAERLEAEKKLRIAKLKFEFA